MNFKNTSINELFKNNILLDEYFNSSNKKLSASYRVNKDLYVKMEMAGLLDTLTAVSDGNIVGFVVISTSINPNYGNINSTVMALYVSKQYRKYGTAKKLINLAEVTAKNKGSNLLTISSPVNSLFNKYLPKIGYTHLNNFYGKDL